MAQMDGQRAQQYYGLSISAVIPARSLEGPAPLSFEQEQLWFLAQLIPDLAVYNGSLTIGFKGSLDVTAFEQGLNEFINRHQIWRTSFPTVDGQPVQVIHPASNLKLSLVDLRNLPEAERESKALRLAAEDIMRPFDLAHGPLLRAMLVRLGDEDYRLFMALHHIIFDAVSIYQVFLPELHALYGSFSSGKPSPLPPLPIQYADYAAWERESLQKDIFAQHLAYWKQQLSGAPAILQLPTDHPRLAVQSLAVQTFEGAQQSLVLPKTLTDALQVLSRQEDATLFMTLLAAFQILLQRYTGREDLIVGSSVAKRKQTKFEGLIGSFVSTLALRTNLSGNPSFRELLARVRDVILGAYSHADLPFEQLEEELQPEGNLNPLPTFDVMINLINTPPAVLELPGLTISIVQIVEPVSRFPMTLYVEAQESELSLRLVFQRALFLPGRITSMLNQLQLNLYKLKIVQI